jgi:hypothetical protein
MPMKKKKKMNRRVPMNKIGTLLTVCLVVFAVGCSSSASKPITSETLITPLQSATLQSDDAGRICLTTLPVGSPKHDADVPSQTYCTSLYNVTVDVSASGVNGTYASLHLRHNVPFELGGDPDFVMHETVLDSATVLVTTPEQKKQWDDAVTAYIQRHFGVRDVPLDDGSKQ